MTAAGRVDSASGAATTDSSAPSPAAAAAVGSGRCRGRVAAPGSRGYQSGRG